MGSDGSPVPGSCHMKVDSDLHRAGAGVPYRFCAARVPFSGSYYLPIYLEQGFSFHRK